MERYSSIREGKIIFRTGAISYDTFAGRALALYIALNMLKIAGSLFTEVLTNSVTTIVFALLFILYLAKHYSYLVIVLKKTAALYLVFSCILVLSLLNSSSGNNELFSRFLWLLAFGLPLFGVLINVSDTSFVLKETERTINIAVVIALLTLAQSVGRGIKGDYSMALGYALLYPALLLMWRIRKRKQWIDIVMLLILLFVIVSYGSRGQILSLGIYLLMSILFGEERVTARKTIVIVIVAGIACLLYFNLESILRFAIQLLGNRGIQSRSLGYFLERAHYTGREVVWEAAVARIKERPFLGWGLSVDISEPGFYPHNLFLEFSLHYGVIIGGVLSLYVIIQTINNTIIYREHDTLTLMLCCYGFVPLMLTSEYLVWPSFWAFIGLCVGRKKRIRGVSYI